MSRALVLASVAVTASACGRSSGPPRVQAALVSAPIQSGSTWHVRPWWPSPAPTTATTAPQAVIPIPAQVHASTTVPAAPAGHRYTLSTATASQSAPAGGRSGTFMVTCYGPPEFPAGQHTSTGRPVGPGSLAVDPRVVPYGSTVVIPGWGTFTADDTGGAIKGHRLDMWRSSCAGFPNPTVTASW